MRAPPASTISPIVRPLWASTFTGLPTALQTALISSPVAQAGGVEDVGAGPFVGLQARDRVVEVGVAADVVLGARGEHEREAEAAGRLDGGGDPLDRLVEVVEAPRGVVVLDRAADRARLGGAGDARRGVARLGAVAVLEVDGDRQVRRRVEQAHVGDDLVERGVAVRAPEREREPGARRRERLEPERREDLGGPRVPRVGDDERVALVQRTEPLGLLVLRGHTHLREIRFRRRRWNPSASNP